MATPIPGCSDCGKTSHGGKTKDMTVEREPRYQVWSKEGDPVGVPFRSVTAAATFMRGYPGSKVVDLLSPH